MRADSPRQMESLLDQQYSLPFHRRPFETSGEYLDQTKIGIRHPAPREVRKCVLRNCNERQCSSQDRSIRAYRNPRPSPNLLCTRTVMIGMDRKLRGGTEPVPA